MKTVAKEVTNIPEEGLDTREIHREIETFIKKKLYQPENRDKHLYHTDFRVDGPADMLIQVSALIKVCIMALDRAGSGAYSEFIP